MARSRNSAPETADLPLKVAIDGRCASSNAVLLFDGVFLFRRELNAYWDFRVLLDVDAPTSVARAVERDAGPDADADVVRRKYDVRYEPAWRMYCEFERPDVKADVVIDNRDVAAPRFLKGGPARR